MRLLISLLSLCLVSGCTSVTDPFLETGAITPDAPAIATSVAPEFAAAYIPGVAGTVENIRQTIREDYLEQSVVYENRTSTSGENVLTVKIGKPGSGSDFLHPPTMREIQREIRRDVAGVAMSIQPVIGDNVHGVFGYATGPLGKGGSCLYAWQLAKSITPKIDMPLKTIARSNYAAQIRLRFCHPAIPEDRIATLMDGLRIKPVTAQTFDMLRYAAGSAYGADAGMAVAAEPVHRTRPIADAVEEPVQEETVEDIRRPVARHVVAETPQNTDIRNSTKVPLPGDVARTASASSDQPVVEPSADKGGKIVKAKPSLVPLPGSLIVSSAE